MTAYLNLGYKTYQNFTLEKFCTDTLKIDTYEQFAKKHPTIDKVIYVSHHALRLIFMIPFARAMPFSNSINCSLLFASGLYYRIPTERLCTRRFTLLSCFGAMSYLFAESRAFKPLSLIPLASYIGMVGNDVFFPPKTINNIEAVSCCGN